VRAATAPAIPQVDLRRSLPTRAAEAMYWTGRTAERAEMAARTVLVCLTRLAGAEPEGDDLAAVARALRAVGGGLAATLGAGPVDLDAEVRQALTGRTGSVVTSLRATTANARAARQLLSAGTWRLLAMLDAEAVALDKLAGGGETPDGLATFDATEALDRVLVPLAALAGLANESVVRGPGWRFLDVGRRIERSLLVLGLLEALFAGPRAPRPRFGAPRAPRPRCGATWRWRRARAWSPTGAAIAATSPSTRWATSCWPTGTTRARCGSSSTSWSSTSTTCPTGRSAAPRSRRWHRAQRTLEAHLPLGRTGAGPRWSSRSGSRPGGRRPGPRRLVRRAAAAGAMTRRYRVTPPHRVPLRPAEWWATRSPARVSPATCPSSGWWPPRST
jgi:hypothetical protein